MAARAQVMAALVPATSAQAPSAQVMVKPESPAPAIRERRVFPQQAALAWASRPPDQMAKTALDPVTYDGVADSLADDETRTRRGIDLPRLVRVRCTACT